MSDAEKAFEEWCEKRTSGFSPKFRQLVAVTSREPFINGYLLGSRAAAAELEYLRGEVERLNLKVNSSSE